jgi:DNA-binding Xre family transcriptional regulator
MSLQMIAIATDEFARLRAKLPAVTADQIMAAYGISETTWRKLRKGVPVRVETLERIRVRYARMS